jgi:hypothetical protein
MYALILRRTMKKEPVQSTVKVTHQESVLDEALEESFPASDPVAVDISRVDPAANKSTVTGELDGARKKSPAPKG